MKLRLNRWTIALLVLNEIRGAFVVGPIVWAWWKARHGL
jgi:hypothetical protein